jgi:3-oxoacyl-[acyl-carrier protein] reductase
LKGCFFVTQLGRTQDYSVEDTLFLPSCRYGGKGKKKKNKMLGASLAGRVAIVTGASKGIGKGIAMCLLRHGVHVMAVAREEKGLTALLEEMNKLEFPGKIEICAADCSEWDQVQNMVAQCLKKFSRVDILCANAGVYPKGAILDLDPSEWDKVMKINLKSTFLCTKAVGAHFKEQKKGRIILTSSITGVLTGDEGWSHYGASKAGQIGFMKTAALELAPFVTVNAVLPGNIMTEGLEGLGADYLERMAQSNLSLFCIFLFFYFFFFLSKAFLCID